MNGFSWLWSRRRFFKAMSGAALTVCFSDCLLNEESTQSRNHRRPSSKFLDDFGPIDRNIGDTYPREFSGDDFTRPHKILWDIPGYLATHQVTGPEEEANVVVIGGGVSGLFSAYCLADHKPIVLEQAPRLGGNAKGQSWRGMDYALGSAYIDFPEGTTPMKKYFDELGWKDLVTERKTSDPVEFEGKTVSNFWSGETEPDSKQAYDKLTKVFQGLAEEKALPNIPPLNDEERKALETYDEHDLYSFVAEKAGGKLPPHLEAAFEYYCWSTFGASSKELSAAALLNFLSQEASPTAVAAGGNARLLEPVIEAILKKTPESNLRTSAIVVQVKVDGDFVKILYEGRDGKLRAIRSKIAVMACPKFVAKKILVDIEPERQALIEELEYRAYVTAHVLLKKAPTARFYDMFMLGNAKVDMSKVKREAEERNATDFVMANFAAKNADQNILTLYKTFPYEGGRNKIYRHDAYLLQRRKFEEQIEKSILPLLNVSGGDVVDLRLTRWGHALPVAAKGLYQKGKIDKLREPFRQKVFFVEQDNWAYPAFETGATEAALLLPKMMDAMLSR